MKNRLVERVIDKAHYAKVRAEGFPDVHAKWLMREIFDLIDAAAAAVGSADYFPNMVTHRLKSLTPSARAMLRLKLVEAMSEGAIDKAE